MLTLLWEGLLILAGFACVMIAAYELWNQNEQGAQTWLIFAIIFRLSQRKEQP